MEDTNSSISIVEQTPSRSVFVVGDNAVSSKRILTVCIMLRDDYAAASRQR